MNLRTTARHLGVAVITALTVAAPATALADAPIARPAPAGSAFSFGLWGDMPYAKGGDYPKMTRLVNDINSETIAFSVYDGDVKDGSSLCTPDQYAGATELFNSMKVPTIYVPGDNEWTDCHRTNNGGFNNIERLNYIRRTMFNTPNSFGKVQMVLEHQGVAGAAYSENRRWTYGDVVFVTINQPGSNNNKINSDKECTDKSARVAADCDADNAEYKERDAKNVAWLRSSFDLAKKQGSKGVVIVTQGDPGFDLPETEGINERRDPSAVGMPPSDGYTNFLNILVDETLYYSGQVLFVHGDTHFFKMDKPLMSNGADRDVREATGTILQNFTRVMTFGSPAVHWLKIEVDPSSRALFKVSPMMVAGN